MSKPQLVVVKSDRGIDEAVKAAEEYAADGYEVQAVLSQHSNISIVLQLRPEVEETAIAPVKKPRAKQTRRKPGDGGDSKQAL